MQLSSLISTKCGLLGLLIAALVVAPSLAAQNEIPQARLTQRPLIVAHRGRPSPDQPENSLQQIESTASRKIGVELDLSPSKDGVLYLLHDDTLDRTTTGHGALKAMDSTALDALRLKDGKGQVTNVPLTRLTQVLQWADGAPDVVLMLDLKGVPAAKVVPLLHDKALMTRTILLTFDRGTATEVLKNSQDALVSVLVKNQSDINYYRRVAGGRQLAMYVPQGADRDLFAKVHRAQALAISDVLQDGNADVASLADKARSEGCQAYRDYIEKRRIDVLVSNNPVCAAQAVQ